MSAQNDKVNDSVKSNKLLEILMQQNSQMEREIQRLNTELSELTKGILKRGYLHKFRDREISYASKWGLRYFVLQGSTLSYFADDKEHRPRRSIDLTDCMVMNEGLKGGYYVFSIYWPTHEEENDVDNSNNGSLVGSLLIRLSSTSKGDASQWISTLEKATKGSNSSGSSINDSVVTGNSTLQTSIDGNSIDVDALVSQDNDPRSVETLKRVRSSNLILQLSQSRLPMYQETKANDLGTTSNSHAGANSKVLHVSKSGRSLLETQSTSSTIAPVVTKPADRKRRFPASKPIHIECKFSPLSVEGRPSEQNYRGFFNLVSNANILLNIDHLVF